MSRLKGAAEWAIGVRGKKVLKYWALRAKTALGAPPFTALNRLDQQLLAYLPDRGFFVEAGANDGIDQSNTFYLETKMGWRGLLIEPIPELARLASRFRTATVVNAALGAPEDSGKTIELPFGDLVSSYVRPTRPTRWGGLMGANPAHSTATVRTLSEIIEAVGAPEVDFLSLDVEGYELQALAGLDLNKTAPRFILVETDVPDRVCALLGERYRRVAQLSFHDTLYARS